MNLARSCVTVVLGKIPLTNHCDFNAAALAVGVTVQVDDSVGAITPGHMLVPRILRDCQLLLECRLIRPSAARAGIDRRDLLREADHDMLARKLQVAD